jgi:hypothetical protein
MRCVLYETRPSQQVGPWHDCFQSGPRPKGRRIIGSEKVSIVDELLIRHKPHQNGESDRADLETLNHFTPLPDCLIAAREASATNGECRHKG